MNSKLQERILNFIHDGNENEQIDFKQEWHSENERLLHDILCFANTVHNEDCYLIFGVSDSCDIIGVSDLYRKKQADVLDLLSNVEFAGGNVPNIAVDSIPVEGKTIDVLTVFNSFRVPYFVTKKPKPYTSIREGFIYTRQGDRNTPISQNAALPEIEMLWKKHLGLTLPALEQIKQRLSLPLEWFETEDGYYNIYRPEYQLKTMEYDCDRYVGEFYVYMQTNPSFWYEMLEIKCNTTVLERAQLVTLDSGRYTTPVPEWGFLKDDDDCSLDYTYKYFLMDSLEYALQQFMYDSSNSEQRWAKRNFDKVVLYFRDDAERWEFEHYVVSNPQIMEKNLSEIDTKHFFVESENQNEVALAKERLATGLALNKMLQAYRGEQL